MGHKSVVGNITSPAGSGNFMKFKDFVTSLQPFPGGQQESLQEQQRNEGEEERLVIRFKRNTLLDGMWETEEDDGGRSLM